MRNNHWITFVPLRVWIMVALICAGCLQPGPVRAEDIVHMGFSRSIIGIINENDTMAAVKLWASELVVRNDSHVVVYPTIYDGVRDIETALEQQKVDLVNLSADEFFDLRPLLGNDPFIFAVYGGSITVEYLLLAPQKSNIADIEDLKGGTLRVQTNAKTALSTLWLDVHLAKAGLPVTKHFFGKMVTDDKISRALLPVFFGKADACLVTRNGFDTMAELNPQILQRIKVVAVSPKCIPGFLGFRRNFQSGVKGTIIDNIKNWHNTPAGQQILTIFQMDNLVLGSLERLGPTMELIKEYRQLIGSDR